MHKQGIRRKSRQKKYYFSKQLKKQLDQISCHPLTLVEAPSGFGKTTAIREYLKENLPVGACEYWYTCLGEPASMAWKGICELLANVNAENAASLRKLEIPTMDTLLHISATLKKFRCQTETYLVVDNYQLAGFAIPIELMYVFSMHGTDSLHMIFITQQIGIKQQFLIHNSDIHIINTSAFFFDREGTSRLFRMEGIRLSADELENVFMSTGGWVSAIRLQIINYEENGSFDHTADIEHLVEKAIWNRLLPEQKDFLLSVSVLDGFDIRQAAIMMGTSVLSKNLENLLKLNDFIRYSPDRGIYTIHSILQDYLQNRFYHYQPEEYQERILRLAGQSYSAVSRFYTATQFFLKVKDYDAILSMPFNGEYLANQRKKGIRGQIAALVNECPEETLCRYPFVMLIFAYPMMLERQFEIFYKLCRLIERGIQENYAGLDSKKLRRLKGEYMLLKSFMAYNDIRKMNKSREVAWEILRAPSSIINKNIPWTFGSASVLFMFWRESGKLDDTLGAMDECLPLYLKLTRNHGAGASSVMRAEAMLMRGEDNEAEILCYKALYDARNYDQVTICICAELVLARIAILRGDAAGYFNAVNNIQNYAKENTTLYVQRMADLSISAISLVLGVTDNVAKWFCDLRSIKQILYAPSIPYAQTLYSMLLLLEKRYNELLGISPLIMDTAKSRNYLMPQIYQLKCLAAVKYRNGREEEAAEYIKEALTIALPDKIYLPFAQQINSLDILLKSGMSPAFDRESLKAIKVLSIRQKKGTAAIKKAILQAKSPLTPREREIALLAKDRFSAKEIASQLYISETTVRTILRNVYRKLDIHARAELSRKKF